MRRFIVTIFVGLLVLGFLLAASQRAPAQEKAVHEIFARLTDTLREGHRCFFPGYPLDDPVYLAFIPSSEQRSVTIPSERLIVLHQGLFEYVWSLGPQWRDVLAGLMARRLIEIHIEKGMQIAGAVASLPVAYLTVTGDPGGAFVLDIITKAIVKGERERLIDTLGARLACLAGYDPQALASYFNRHARKYQEERASDPFYFAPGGGEPYNPYAEQAKRSREEAVYCSYWRRCDECR